MNYFPVESPHLASAPWDQLNFDHRRRLISSIQHCIHVHGFAYVTGLVLPPMDEAECERVLRESSLELGIPASHDLGGNEVWRIAVKNEYSEVPTFSQHNGAAGLHTDSQYREHPEDAFSLFTVSQASCGGGESWILHVRDIHTALSGMPDGERYLRLLRTEPVPFASPTIFNLEGDASVEVIEAPIFEGDKIRYRQDTLLRGRQEKPIENPELMKALEALEVAIHDNPNIQRFHADEGSCLYIDNKRTLHGRSEFHDSRRLMLRLRFNFDEANPVLTS